MQEKRYGVNEDIVPFSHFVVMVCDIFVGKTGRNAVLL